MVHFSISVKEMYVNILRHKFRLVMLYYKITDICMRFL